MSIFLWSKRISKGNDEMLSEKKNAQKNDGVWGGECTLTFLVKFHIHS